MNTDKIIFDIDYAHFMLNGDAFISKMTISGINKFFKLIFRSAYMMNDRLNIDILESLIQEYESKAVSPREKQRSTRIKEIFDHEMLRYNITTE